MQCHQLLSCSAVAADLRVAYQPPTPHLPNAVAQERERIGVPVLARRAAVQVRRDGHAPCVTPHAAAVRAAAGAAAAGRLITATEWLIL